MFILQIGASCIEDIDMFLVFCLDRYGVLEYFNGVGIDPLEDESPEKFSQLVDDFLNLLIVMLSERALRRFRFYP
jgi:hypothetical protein